jgi:hypothetical protein
MILSCGAESPYLGGSLWAYRSGSLQNLYVINQPLGSDGTVFVGGYFLRYGRRIRAPGQKLSTFIYPLRVLEGFSWGGVVPGFSPTFHHAFLYSFCALKLLPRACTLINERSHPPAPKRRANHPRLISRSISISFLSLRRRSSSATSDLSLEMPSDSSFAFKRLRISWRLARLSSRFCIRKPSLVTYSTTTKSLPFYVLLLPTLFTECREQKFWETHIQDPV